MKLCVLSGKGGTGKTTFAVNLAVAWQGPVCLMDCDVEEPDCHIFLPPDNPRCEDVSVLVPQIDESRCDACGECSSFCQFHALAKLGKKLISFPELCHSCGGCAKVCPKGAIREMPRRIGEISSWEFQGIRVMQGLMDLGNPAAPPLIRALKAKSPDGMDLILDAPPGASCPAATTVRGCDFALLVCEPTPFGVHDMAIEIEMLRKMRLPFAVAINKSGENDAIADDFCAKNGIEVLGKLEESRETASLLSRGVILAKTSASHMQFFESLAAKLRKHVEEAGGANYETV